MFSLKAMRPRTDHPTPLPLTTLLLAGLFGSGTLCAAPEDNAGRSPMETLVVTASRVEQPIDHLAGSLSVVSNADLKMVDSIHVSEVLARVPGVWINRGNGQEHLTAIRSPVLTGAGSCGAFYVAEDGVPVRAVGFCNVNELFDINTEQAQRIEVLRGPGTALHGSNALHGVINVISQPPLPGDDNSIALEGGPHDYGRVKLSVGSATEKQGLRLNVNGASDGGYKDDSSFDQQKFTLRYDYHGSTWNSATLVSGSNLNQETAGYVEGTDAYKDESRQRENPNPEAYRDTQSLRLQTRFQRDLDRGGEFLVTPYARHTNMEFMMHFLPGTPVEKNGQTGVGIQTTFRRPVSDKLVLTQGVDAEFTDAWLEQNQATGFSSFPAGKQYDYEVDATMVAAFIAGEYQWTDQLSLVLGTRLESLAYDYDNRMISGNTDQFGNVCINSVTLAVGCRYSRPDDRKDDFENLSGNAGLIYRVSPALIGTLRLSHGFRAPQATELYRLQEGQLVANLDSEELNSIELGVKGTVGTGSYELTGYYMKKNNVIFQSSDRLNLDDGQTRHVGLEYQFAWQMTAHWDISVSGTFAHHTYTANVTAPGSNTLISTRGNDVDSAPRHMSTLQLGWQPLVSTRVELEWVEMGSYYTDIENEHRYDGHDLLNLRMRHRLTDTVSCGLRLTNLTDRSYADRADYSAFGGDRYFIGEPRSVYGDIRFTF